jgi:ribonucleoside-diphosphate reductase alpha chain
VVFIDRINEHNPTPHVGRIEATNPCGEQPLLPYEACNLGSIDLSKFVKPTGPCRGEVDWDGLRTTVQESVRFLDNVIDANVYPLPEIEQMCRANRKIGLGVMGYADALYMLGVRYNSDEGVAWGERLMKFINDEGHAYSEQLANERGSFPNWVGSVWETRDHRPMRNSTVTTVAPTGTISIMADCSCGIEPMFSLAFYRNVLKGQDEGRKPMLQVNPVFENYAKANGFHSEGLMDQVARDGTLAAVIGVPEEAKRIFVCAHDIEPDWHVRMQAAFQRHCDSSISKTINFPHNATMADVEIIYRQAYALRCKGVTVYRDGCRSEQPMALKESEKKTEQPPKEARAVVKEESSARMAEMPVIAPRDIPEIVSGLRLRQVTPFGNMHVKITVDPKSGRELEVFAQLGKGGDIANSDLEAICRLTSLWLRSGGALRYVIQQLKDIGSSLQVPTREGKIMSLGDGLARALQRYMRAKERFGLRDLLLGECDLSELNKPAPASRSGKGNGNGSGEESPAARAGTRGNGRGNGHGSGQGTTSVSSHALAIPVATETAEATLPARSAFKVKCPSCGEGLIFAEGCNKCMHCGWAQC